MHPVTQDSYQRLGASASKKGIHAALSSAGLAADSDGLFASVMPDLAGDNAYCSFLHCDGAGTKSIVAYLLYRVTGQTSHFAGLAQDALVMNIDDVFCIGTPESLMLSNLVGRNSRLISDDILRVLFESYRSLAEKFAALGVPFTLAGGETADCGDVVRTLMVDAVLAGRIKKSSLVRASNIKPGDVIIGLSSTGKAEYEAVENSGIGSNGLTLARHALLSSTCADKFPEVLDPHLDQEIRYRGPFSVVDRAPGLTMTVGEALASPTRSYAPVLAKIFAECGAAVHGVIHQTGGGQTKVLRFGKGNRIIKDALFPTPPLFALIQKHGAVPWREMYQVFNMGHRMEVYADPSAAGRIIDLASAFGIEAKKIGRVEKNSSATANAVVVHAPDGVHEYTLAS